MEEAIQSKIILEEIDRMMKTVERHSDTENKENDAYNNGRKENDAYNDGKRYVLCHLRSLIESLNIKKNDGTI